jgi:hypothetical protein
MPMEEFLWEFSKVSEVLRGSRDCLQLTWSRASDAEARAVRLNFASRGQSRSHFSALSADEREEGALLLISLNLDTA